LLEHEAMRALFLVMDTVRRDFLSCYGNTWVHTPNLAKLAARGVTFENHFVGSLPCMPARREFMTGRYNFLYRGWGPIEPYDDTLPKWLRERRGVFSHLLTDHDHYFELGGENYHTAFNTWEFYRGQEHDPWASQVDQVALPEGWNAARSADKQLGQNYLNRLRMEREEDFSGPRTCAAAVEWLEANRHAKGDWFLQVELFDPHEPFHCTQKYLDLYGGAWNGPVADWPAYDVLKESPETVEQMRKCYAGLLTMTDHWAGKVLAKLEEIGQFDDTLIVFTTDHGTLLGEHGYWLKNFMPLYDEIVRIPLIIKPPRGEAIAGRRVLGMTQTIDLMPTFLDYFDCPLPPHVHGRSVRPLIEGDIPVRVDGIFGYFGKATNITDGRHVYMRMPVNDDAGLLHAYTAMPVAGLNQWFPRSDNERMEMGRYFGHTYNLPQYKIPSRGEVPRALPGEPSYQGRHLLFDTITDPKQERPIDDAQLEARFIARLEHHLAQCEAPAEQYVRLGLTPPMKA
jgi:arylsulfatase A-like enzyme